MLSRQEKLEKLVRRSKLFVPVNREKFIDKAWTRGADCIILDLEDAVPANEKEKARRLVKRAIPVVSRGGAEVQVRINRDMEAEDLDACIHPGLAAIMIPKCESAAEIRTIDAMVSALENERGLEPGIIQFDLLIESATGVMLMEEIFPASPRIVQCSAGGVDLARDMRYTRVPGSGPDVMGWAAGRHLFAARAAGVQACGMASTSGVGLFNTGGDREKLLEACHASFLCGYLGTPAIHPVWCEPINEGFKSSGAELDRARRVKSAVEEALSRGEGSTTLDGRMVDLAHLEDANLTLARADHVAKREAEKAAAMERAR